MSEGPNPLPWSKARSWFAKPRWCFLATEWIRDVGWNHNFSFVLLLMLILWRYWDSILVLVSGPSQELICQEARNHFPDSTLFPVRSRALSFVPYPSIHSQGLPLRESSSLWCVHFQSHELLKNVCMFKSRSFIHKRETQGKIISLALYSQCFSDSLFWLWGRQKQLS